MWMRVSRRDVRGMDPENNQKEHVMKVSIDADLCTGCGACADDVPDVFVMGEEVAEVTQPDVPADLEDAVKDAAEGCPVEAILVS
jgi:ferredoxin